MKTRFQRVMQKTIVDDGDIHYFDEGDGFNVYSNVKIYSSI